ncbi:MAG TPA: dihydroneopterin aldolase [Syntrophomonadaceae bacterium]|nr:dihydroneopterin aldolase [Syntrophomonadaceae bacterium]
MDRIVARGLTFEGCHGVLPQEKSVPQRFLVDLELFLDLGPAGRKDNLEYTIDYSAIFQCVKELVENHSFNLIETLAENIAEAILSVYSISSVRVGVKKPDAPVAGNFEYFGVIIERFKQ